jgi:hypothetical protein
MEEGDTKEETELRTELNLLKKKRIIKFLLIQN